MSDKKTPGQQVKVFVGPMKLKIDNLDVFFAIKLPQFLSSLKENSEEIYYILILWAPRFQKLYSVEKSFAICVTIKVLFVKELPHFLLSVTIPSHDFFESLSIANMPKAQVFPSKWRLGPVGCFWQDWFVQIFQSLRCFLKKSCLDFWFL